jgi:hypothetical protein
MVEDALRWQIQLSYIRERVSSVRSPNIFFWRDGDNTASLILDIGLLKKKQEENRF